MFFGRKIELTKLKEFAKRNIAGLVVIYGRRRIGKSTLVEHFSQNNKFIELYGLPPYESSSNKQQLHHFSFMLSKEFKIPAKPFANWYDALSSLAELTKKGRYIILLDEISWMATYDKNFTAILKGLWDTKFKKNNQLILILCGSVSSWIQDNILKDKGYVGRVSLQMKLEEMPLHDANKFWQGNTNISAFEKFKLLCVTGGVPRYLEELNIKQTAEQNIKRLCYHPEGLLFNEFNSIFQDIFGRQSDKYKDIVKQLLTNNIGQVSKSDILSQQLNTLESAGFIRRDFIWNINSAKLSSSRYRLSDNYLRFYLKYIEPNSALINQHVYDIANIESLPNWQSIMGLQFENLVLNNLSVIIHKLNIAPEMILSAAPHFQSASINRKAAQIDLLIHTKSTLYVCEIKFRKKLGTEFIAEMIKKIKCLKIPNNLSIRPVLIYQGQLSKSLVKANYFSHMLQFADFLNDY